MVGAAPPAPPSPPTPLSGHMPMRVGVRVGREGTWAWEVEVSAAATAAAAGASPSPPPPTRACDVAYSLPPLPCCGKVSTGACAAELWVGSMPQDAALVEEREAECAGAAAGVEEEEECVWGGGGKESKSGELFTWNSCAVSFPKSALSLLAASALSFPAAPTATPMACTASAMCLKKGALRRSAARVRSLAAWG